MLKKILLFVFSVTSLFSLVLDETYYIDSNDVKLLDIIPHANYDITLYHIASSRYSKRIKSKEIIKTLKKHGYKDIQADSNYVNFVRKSPIDTTKVIAQIQEYYQKNYSTIDIQKIKTNPRGYVKSLKEPYTIHMPRRAYLSNKGTFYIKNEANRKIFFDYSIKANLYVYITSKKIKRAQELTSSNSDKKLIKFERFRAKPLDNIFNSSLQSKQHIAKGRILTTRDIEQLNIVRRGDKVVAMLHNNNIEIEFAAQAVQSGKLNDIITIQRSDKKRFKATIVGKNRVEIR